MSNDVLEERVPGSEVLEFRCYLSCLVISSLARPMNGRKRFVTSYTVISEKIRHPEAGE